MAAKRVSLAVADLFRGENIALNGKERVESVVGYVSIVCVCKCIGLPCRTGWKSS